MKETIKPSATMSRELSFTPLSPGDGSKAKGGVAIGSHGKMKITPKSACDVLLVLELSLLPSLEGQVPL
jgi:hypothetical protein